jgi:hypothetical protein
VSPSRSSLAGWPATIFGLTPEWDKLRFEPRMIRVIKARETPFLRGDGNPVKEYTIKVTNVPLLRTPRGALYHLSRALNMSMELVTRLCYLLTKKANRTLSERANLKITSVHLVHLAKAGTAGGRSAFK